MGVLVYLDDVIVMSSYLFRLQRLVRPVWPHVHDMWCASEERTDLLLEVRHVLQHGALVGGRPDIVLGRGGGEGGHNRVHASILVYNNNIDTHTGAGYTNQGRQRLHTHTPHRGTPPPPHTHTLPHTHTEEHPPPPHTHTLPHTHTDARTCIMFCCWER